MKPPWPVAVYEVLGDSMLPSYRSGDFVLSWRNFTPAVDDVIVARINDKPVIKRIKKIDGDALWLEGDNLSASTDSRSYGWVKPSCLVGKVIWRVPAPASNLSGRTDHSQAE